MGEFEEDRPKVRIIDSTGINPYPYRHAGSRSDGVLSAQEVHRSVLRERAAATYPLLDPAS